MTHNLQRTVGDDLIGVHVHRRSRAALYQIGGELVVHLAVDNLLASLRNRLVDLVIDDP